MLWVESLSGRGVQVCQWHATGRWFSPVLQFFATNKTDRHDITEILLNVALNTTKQTNIFSCKKGMRINIICTYIILRINISWYLIHVWRTMTKCNSIAWNGKRIPIETIRTTPILFFQSNVVVVLVFFVFLFLFFFFLYIFFIFLCLMTLQIKHNIHTLSFKIKFIRIKSSVCPKQIS